MPPSSGERRVHEPQSTNNEPRVGISTPCGAVSTRGITVFVPGLSGLSWYGRISDPGMEPYPLGVALARRTPANQRPARGVGFLHRAWRYRPERSSFSSPVCWSCKCIEAFLIPVLPGCRWLHEHHPAAPRTNLELTLGGTGSRTRCVLKSATVPC